MNTTINNTINETIQTMNTTIQQLTQTKGTYEWIMMILVILIIGAIIGTYIFLEKLNKKRQKEKEAIEKLKMEAGELIKKIIETDNNMKEGRIKTKTIYLDNLPEEMRKEIKDKTNVLNEIFADSENGGEPYLFLMMGDGTIEIRKNAKEGELILEKEGIKKRIDLSPQKLQVIKWGNKKIKCWIQYENEAEAYPIKPKHHSERFYYIVEKIIATEGSTANQGKGIPKIIWVIAIVAILGVIAYFVFFADKGGTPQAVQVINETINTTINTTIKAASNTTTPKIINIG